MQLYLKQFAADYDCNAYGSGSYDNNTCTTATDGSLSDTGTNIMPVLGGGVLLVVVALAVLARLLFKKKHQKS